MPKKGITIVADREVMQLAIPKAAEPIEHRLRFSPSSVLYKYRRSILIINTILYILLYNLITIFKQQVCNHIELYLCFYHIWIYSHKVHLMQHTLDSWTKPVWISLTLFSILLETSRHWIKDTSSFNWCMGAHCPLRQTGAMQVSIHCATVSLALQH